MHTLGRIAEKRGDHAGAFDAHMRANRFRASSPAARRMAGEARALMDGQLAGHDWFVGDSVSLADIALFAYTHVADEGGFGLGDYPAVERWIERVSQLPDFIPMG
mgnify:CR=1 FL=1